MASGDRKGSDIGFNRTTRLPPLAPGDSAPAPAGTPITLPSIFVPPPGAHYFTIQAETDLAGGGTTNFGGLANQNGSFQIPERHAGAINTIQFFASVCDATIAGFLFSVLVKGVTLEGFTGLTIPQLGGAQGINSSPIYVEVPEFALVTAQVFAPNGNPHHVGVFIQGWYWPSTAGA